MVVCASCGSSKVDTPDNTAPDPAQQAEGDGETATEGHPEADEKKVIVVYFSATGNTKSVAELVADINNADIFEIVPAEPYSDADLNYKDDNCRANKEQADDSARPAIKGSIDDFSRYDTVFIGHPIWWGIEPRIIDTFMESYDFSGKTVVNFCTSGGSGIASASDNLKSMAKSANWLECMKFSTNASKDDVQKWIDSLNL